MFDLSFGKLAILFTLCLMVLGPEKLPKLAAQLGRFAGQARAMARHFRAQLEQEVAAEDLKKELREAKAAIDEVIQAPASVINPITETATSLAAEASGMQMAAEAAAKLYDAGHIDPSVHAELDSVASAPEPDSQNTNAATQPANQPGVASDEKIATHSSV